MTTHVSLLILPRISSTTEYYNIINTNSKNPTLFINDAHSYKNTLYLRHYSLIHIHTQLYDHFDTLMIAIITLLKSKILLILFHKRSRNNPLIGRPPPSPQIAQPQAKHILHYLNQHKHNLLPVLRIHQPHQHYHHRYKANIDYSNDGQLQEVSEYQLVVLL